jgi:uncharacterized protein (TIGR03083 family)
MPAGPACLSATPGIIAVVEISQHIAAIREAGRRLSAAAAEAGTDVAVPSCPEWVMRDLVRHQGGVHRWAASIVGTPRTEPWNVDLPEVVGTWPDDAELLPWFDAGVEALARVLTQADPGLFCWAFLPAPSPLSMWARRQAHETSVHGVDAELAAGRPVAPFPLALAADGVGELLEGFVPRGRRLRSDQATTLGVRCADVDAGWHLRIGPDGAQTARDGGAGDTDGSADCVVTGSAQDLYLALWNRRPASCLQVEGDSGVLDLFLDRVHIRWS